MQSLKSLLNSAVHVRVIEVAIISVLLLATFGQLPRLVLPTGPVFLHEILMTLELVWWLIIFLSKKNTWRFRDMPVPAPLVRFAFFWLGASVMLAFSQSIDPLLTGMYLLRLGFYITWARGVEWLVQRHQVRSVIVLMGTVLAGGLLAGWGLLQFVIFPDTRWLFWLGWDDHYYRLISTLLDPGFTGILLVLSWVAGWQLVESLDNSTITVWHKKTLQRLFFYVVTALSTLFLTATWLTYSRASYLSLLVISFMLAKRWLRSGWWKAVALSLAFSLAVFAIAPRPGGEGVKLTRTSTISARTSELSAQLAQLHGWEWLVGRGFFVITDGKTTAEYAVPDRARVPNSWAVLVLQGAGVVGLVLTALLGWVIWRHPTISWWWKIQLGAVLVHGLFQASLVYPFVILWLGASWAASSTIGAKKTLTTP